MVRYIEVILLGVFSLVMALGNFNPFDRNFDVNAGIGTASPIIQIIQMAYIAFVVVMCYYYRRVKVVMSSWRKNLSCFMMLFLIFTITHDVLKGWEPILMSIVKFVAVVSFCLFFERYLVLKGTQYIQLSLTIFAIINGVISILFSLGLIDALVSWHSGRAFIFGDNPNSISARLAMSFLIIIDLLVSDFYKFGKKRLLLALLLPPLLSTIMSTGSRGSLLILIACLFVYLYNYIKSNGIKAVGILLFIGLISIPSLKTILLGDSSAVMLERLADTVDSGDDAGRGVINKRTMDIFSDNAIFGAGEIGFKSEMKSRYNDEHTVHNLFYYILVTSGILGFIPFLFYIQKILKAAFRIKHADKMPLILIMFVLVLAAKTGGMLNYLLMWYILALSGSLIILKQSHHE